MGRFYTVNFEKVAITASQDLFEIQPADDKPVRLWGWSFSNVGGVADAGDAQEELLPISIIRGATSSGTGGSAPTPRPLGSTVDTAAGFAAETNNTTKASAAPPLTIFDGGINIRIPDYFFFPDERLCPQASQANTIIVMQLIDAPADSVTCSGTLFVEELG